MKKVLAMALLAAVLMCSTTETKAQTGFGTSTNFTWNNFTWKGYLAELKYYQNMKVVMAAAIPAYGLYCYYRCASDYRFTMKLQYDSNGNEIFYLPINEVPARLLRTSNLDGTPMTEEEVQTLIRNIEPIE